MFFFAHLFAGLIIGKLFGSYLIALTGALIIDLDHLIPYVKYKILFTIKRKMIKIQSLTIFTANY